MHADPWFRPHGRRNLTAEAELHSARRVQWNGFQTELADRALPRLSDYGDHVALTAMSGSPKSPLLAFGVKCRRLGGHLQLDLLRSRIQLADLEAPDLAARDL
jgi:hypothetical protein